MAEYEQSLSIQASPEAVFAFVSDVSNMPQYLPTTHHAETQGEGRVRVQGEANGHPYDSDGWIRFDQDERRMEWGSDGETRYRGWLEVDGGGDASEVTVNLTFAPNPDQAERLEESSGDKDTAIEEGLRASLESIRNILEGKGGKVEPPAAT